MTTTITFYTRTATFLLDTDFKLSTRTGELYWNAILL